MLRTACLVLAICAVAWPRVAASQAPRDPPRISLSVQIGTLGFSDLQLQEVTAERAAGEDVAAETVTLTRHMRAEGGRRAGVNAAIGLGGPWSARVGADVGSARLEQHFAGPIEWLDDARQIAPADQGDIDLLILTTALQYWISTRHTLRPYLELGLTTERWGLDMDPPGELASDDVTRWAGHAAVGGVYLVRPRLGLSFRVSTSVLRTPVPPLEPGTLVGAGDGLLLTTAPVARHGVGDTAVQMVRGTRFDVGISYRPGPTPATPPPSPPESDDPSPPPPH